MTSLVYLLLVSIIFLTQEFERVILGLCLVSVATLGVTLVATAVVVLDVFGCRENGDILILLCVIDE